MRRARRIPRRLSEVLALAVLSLGLGCEPQSEAPSSSAEPMPTVGTQSSTPTGEAAPGPSVGEASPATPDPDARVDDPSPRPSVHQIASSARVEEIFEKVRAIGRELRLEVGRPSGLEDDRRDGEGRQTLVHVTDRLSRHALLKHPELGVSTSGFVVIVERGEGVEIIIQSPRPVLLGLEPDFHDRAEVWESFVSEIEASFAQ